MNKEDNIYIVRVFNRQGNSFVKVGYSSNLKGRLYTYYLHNPLIEVVLTLYNEYGKALEVELHKNFKSVVLNEWYKEEELQDIIKYIKEFSINYNDAGIKDGSGEEKSIVISFKEHSKALKNLSAKEYFFLMQLLETVNDNNLVVGITPDTSANSLSTLLNVNRKEVLSYINKFLELEIIKMENNNYYLSKRFLQAFTYK